MAYIVQCIVQFTQEMTKLKSMAVLSNKMERNKDASARRVIYLQ